MTAADASDFVLRRTASDEDWLREMSSDDQIYAMRVVPQAECNGFCCYHNSHDREQCRYMPDDDVPFCAKYRANTATTGGKVACCAQLGCLGVFAYLMSDPIGWIGLNEKEVERWMIGQASKIMP